MTRHSNTWIFYATPDKYDVNEYLSSVRDYIYWRAAQRSNDMKIGDRVYIWRGGMKGFSQGIIASGVIAEEPISRLNAKHPEKQRDDLWKTKLIIDGTVVGVKLSHIKLTDEDGMLTKDLMMHDPILKKMSVIRTHRHSNYLLNDDEALRIFKLWQSTANPDISEYAEQDELVAIYKNKKNIVENELRNYNPAEPEIISISNKSYKRDNKIIALLKIHRNFECQICKTKILKANGEYYIEAAHIIPKCAKGTESPENILILCPNHHKEFDWGKREIVELSHEIVKFKLNDILHEISLKI